MNNSRATAARPSREDEDRERYLDELEKRIDAHNLNHEIWAQIDRDLRDARRPLLDSPPPRSQCPGCFAAIFHGAARQGWCCDCYEQRHKYEKETYGA